MLHRLRTITNRLIILTWALFIHRIDLFQLQQQPENRPVIWHLASGIFYLYASNIRTIIRAISHLWNPTALVPSHNPNNN